jgi:hypothetical protein
LATTIVALGAVAALASGCGSSSKPSSNASTTTVPSGPAPITITAGDYAFQGVPKTMTAGIQHVTFVNRGQVDHEMAFVKVTPGTKPKSLFAALLKTFQGGPTPAYALEANGVLNTPAGQTNVTSFNLTPGHYIALCTDTGIAGSKQDGPPHFARGMYKQITVTGSGGTEVPAATATITAHDYTFVLNGLKAGEQTIGFRNDGPKQWHFADINVMPKGVTVAQAETNIPKMLASNGPPPAGMQPVSVVSSQIASPGHGSTFTATLLAGRTYVIFCFASDRQGGPPHAIGHHMFKVFSVS